MWLRVAAGALLTSIPVVQMLSRDVMSDVLLGITTFLALLSLGRFLDTEDTKYSCWFGIWASLAILTKGLALFLVLVPPIAVVLTRRYHLFIRFSFWLPALIVAVLCGPWYLLVPGAQHEAVGRFGDVKCLAGKDSIRSPPLRFDCRMVLVARAAGGLGQ